MKKSIAILTFILTLCCSHNQAKAESKLHIQQRLQKTYYSFDSTEYRSIIKSINWEIKKNPDDYFLHYYRTVANINLCRILYNTNPKAARTAISNACQSADLLVEKINIKNSALKKAVGNYGEVEFYTLHSAAYGLRVGLELTTKIKYGKIALNSIKKAHTLDSNNQKVLLTAAKHLMCIPAIFGGDKEKAEKMLHQALKTPTPKNIKVLTADNAEEEYGFIEWAEKPELYAYLAQLEIFRDNPEIAQEYIKKSLQLKAGYGYVLYDLKLQL